MKIERGISFSCAACGATVTRVKDSRPVKVGWRDAVRRRRVCLRCGVRFNTFEVTADAFEAHQLNPGAMAQALKDLEEAVRRISDVISGR